jgi:3',5'-cyclic AMP phosphodiesterase CpdA
VLRLVQLSDPHVGADWEGADPEERLAVAVRAAAALQPDAVIVTGDLAEHGSDDEYARARALLAPLGDVLTLPGNHDDASRFASGYAAGAGPLRIVALDSTIPGADGGALGDLAWLERELATRRPTLVALHHPPLVTGVPAWDEFGLAPDSIAALGEVVARHPHVLGVLAGHLHRPLTGTLAGRPVTVAPSTYVQASLDLRARSLALDPAQPGGFAVHTLRDGALLTHFATTDVRLPSSPVGPGR